MLKVMVEGLTDHFNTAVDFPKSTLKLRTKLV